jgi:hypothetical protein
MQQLTELVHNAVDPAFVDFVNEIRDGAGPNV